MYRERLESLKSNYNMMIGERNRIIADNQKDELEIENLNNLLEITKQVLALLNTVSAEAREKAKNQLESIVTSALQYISEDDYEFKIEMLNRGKPSCEFYVVSQINGIESRQKPQDACGGGFVDIISTALRYTYLNAFKDPVINNAVLLDEPGKMVSELASVKFAEFVKFLGNSFNRQTIMVTHNDNLLNVADNTHLVDKISGASVICQRTQDDELEELLIGA